MFSIGDLVRQLEPHNGVQLSGRVIGETVEAHGHISEQVVLMQLMGTTGEDGQISQLASDLTLQDAQLEQLPGHGYQLVSGEAYPRKSPDFMVW